LILKDYRCYFSLSTTSCEIISPVSALIRKSSVPGIVCRITSHLAGNFLSRGAKLIENGVTKSSCWPLPVDRSIQPCFSNQSSNFWGVTFKPLNFLSSSVSFIKLPSYLQLLLRVYLDSQYYITSNKEAGLGRYDLLLEPKNKEERGFILFIPYP